MELVNLVGGTWGKDEVILLTFYLQTHLQV